MILSLIIFVLSISCVSAGLFDGFFGNDKNITLIKESTSGWAEIYDDGDVQSCYLVEGVFKDLPSNVKGYNLRVALYDETGKLIKEDDGYSMESIAKSSENSNPGYLCSIGVKKLVNVSKVELKIFDDEGVVVFDKNLTFSAENMDIKHVSKSESDTNDDDNYSSTSSDSKYSNKWESELYIKEMRDAERKGTYFNPPKSN